jgi:hypothetical protein
MKDVIAVSEITGKTVSEIVSEAVERDIQKFRDPATNEIAPKKGLWLSNFYEVNSYPEAEQHWEPCLILYHKKKIGSDYGWFFSEGRTFSKKMIGRDYVCIFSEGRIFNTPAEAVKP